jgi:hypothetical protein
MVGQLQVAAVVVPVCWQPYCVGCGKVYVGACGDVTQQKLIVAQTLYGGISGVVMV